MRSSLPPSEAVSVGGGGETGECRQESVAFCGVCDLGFGVVSLGFLNCCY